MPIIADIIFEYEKFIRLFNWLKNMTRLVLCLNQSKKTIIGHYKHKQN